MRFGISVVAIAALVGACDAAVGDAPPPPSPEPARPGAPPVVPPPPTALCPPFPPGFIPPATGPGAAECARLKAEHDAALAKRDAEMKPYYEQKARDWEKLGAIPFAERKQHPMREGMGGWINRLQPTRNGVCRFEEKPNVSRPADYSLSAFSGNIDLWTRNDSLLHDHAIGFVEAWFGSDDPVIAVRQGLPDLWIEPVGDPATVILFIGADRFECVRANTMD